jgi:hypothetical protein
MKNKGLWFILFGMLMLAGCGKQSTGDGGRTATVTLKDGGNFSGVVAKNDGSAITLRAATGETRTYPMSQVDSVQYAADASPGPTPTTVPTTAPPPVVPEPVRTLPAATTIVVRNGERIRAGSTQAGQTFPAVIVRDVIGADGGVAIPKGSNATLVVRAARGQGKVKGRSEIVIDLESVDVEGRHYHLETTDIARSGKQGMGKNRRSAKFIGGGALLGTVIGAVAGGPKGAMIGAGAGAGAGAGLQAVTRGKAVSIPPETILSFRLEEPVDIALAQ